VPQSLANVLIHLVFSTKLRTPNLRPEIRASLFPYVAATLTKHGCPVIQIGGVEDHVHILYSQSRTMTIAQVVEKAKTSSSKMLKERVPNFAWQLGYGAFSVGRDERNVVVQYIRAQEEHHRKETFQEEYLRILEELGVPYDPRYLWE
jgi:REP element-mobilizing transposase RayT